jgi:2-methylcitrate dehydratase PrpD
MTQLEQRPVQEVTATLAEWVAGLRFADLPAASVQTAAECILDAIGAGVVGASLPIGGLLQQLVDREGRGTPDHTVIGSDQGASSLWAALVNGCLMHSEDWDDTPHTSYFLPALLATSEELDSSGQELITAWVAAYEIWTRVIPALDIDRQHNPTGVIGPMVAALGAGYLRHFSAEQLQTALSIGAASSGGLRANFGTLAKPLDAGNSARAGVQAAVLTSLGWTAEKRIFEGLEGVRYRGLFDTFGGTRKDPSKAVAALGALFNSAARADNAFGGGALDPQTWPPRWAPPDSRGSEIAANGRSGRGAPTIKAWPACFGHNAALTALFTVLLEPGFNRAQVDGIELMRSTAPTDSATFRTDPATGLEAKFSVPFVLAAAWLDGDVDVSTFRDENYRRIYSSGYLERVRIVVDRNRTERDVLTVRLKDGTDRQIALGRGLALQGQGVVDKFVHNATPLLGAPDAKRVADRIMHLDQEWNVSSLIGAFGRRGAPA